MTGATIVDPREWGTGIYSVLGLATRDTTTFDLEPPVSEYRGIATFLPGAYADSPQYEIHSPFNTDTRSDPTMMYIAADRIGYGTSIVARAFAGGPTAYSAFFSWTDETSVTLPPWSTSYLSVPVTIADAAGQVDIDSRATTVPVSGGRLPVSFGYVADDARLDVISVLPDLILLEASGSRSLGALTVSSSVYEVREAALVTSGLAVDFSVAPRIDTFSADRSDPERPSVSWSGAIASGSTATGSFSYVRSTARITWRVFAAPSERELRLPRLPDELADLRPTPEVPPYGFQWIDGGATLSWAGFRAHPLRHWSDRTSRVAIAATEGTF